jgi:type II secretory pathway pseudopilin PulG
MLDTLAWRTNPMRTCGPEAFTLIELLVIVTIIVLLLALLAPALDEAVYQAELAVCQARMRGAGTGVIQYTLDNRRAYPMRQGPRDTVLQWVPNEVASNQYDDRGTIFKAVDPVRTLDPFCPPIDPAKSGANTFVAVSYCLWFDWRFQRGFGEASMSRYGDRFTWTDSAGVQTAYSLLMSDEDRVTGGLDMSSHPDRDGILAASPAYQDEPNIIPFFNLVGAFVTMSYWSSAGRGPQVRGALDLNYAYDDGSATRLNHVTLKDPRVNLVPDHTLHGGPSVGTTSWRQIPAR